MWSYLSSFPVAWLFPVQEIGSGELWKKPGAEFDQLASCRAQGRTWRLRALFER